MRKAFASAVIAGCLSTGLVWAVEPIDRPVADRPVGDRTTVDRAVTGALPQGVTARDLNDQEDERSVLASATNAALTNGGFDDLCERLSTLDRKRLGDAINRDATEINGRVDQIAKIWKEKYGHEFKFDQKLLESFVVIREGEVTDPAMAKAHWPVNAVTTDLRNAMEREAIPAAATDAGYLDKGRNVAIVTIPASHGLPGMNLSMLHESVDDWRLDIPDGISGEQIYNNLKTRLTTIGENVANWPASEPEAYRLVAHNVFAAIYNVETSTTHKMDDMARPVTP